MIAVYDGKPKEIYITNPIVEQKKMNQEHDILKSPIFIKTSF